ncbi:MAG: histidinol dehydrogenase [Actinomycetota bacterium]|nr:histidinol dehydrogenase [Actinomycetota bacterium]
MLTRLDLRTPAGADWRSSLPRPQLGKDSGVAAVRAILADVRDHGDAAVREYTERFDGVRLESLRVPADEVGAALGAVAPEFRQALEAASESILAFHHHQLLGDSHYERDGVAVRELRRPMDRAGLYVPGGRARYPSTVLMTAIPARVAGVPELVLCVPPEAGGTVAAPTLAAAALAGVDEIYRIGGAQAVAAMAYGTETIRPVDVVVGPGNLYVAEAKRQVAAEGVVGVPAPFAGPSEVVVVADEATPVTWAAIDVVVQAEHGPDGLAWLVTWSEGAADAISAEVSRLVAASPRRHDIEATLAEGGYAVVVDGPEQAMEVANAIAPEHLEIMSADPEALVPLVRHAGAVFCGPYSPASVGDYLAGPSHVLPTYGSARFAGALRVDDFVKTVHVITVDQPGLARVAPHVAALAEAEGLAAHAESVRLRWAR